MASPRAAGSQKATTRDTLLDSTEQIMLADGYAAVTYRSVAAGAGVSVGTLQYYFPSLDNLFIAVFRRLTDRSLKTLTEALQRRNTQPLHVLWEFWEYNRDETSTLMLEFMALANHRKSIASEIAEVTEQSRKVQLDALTQNWEYLTLPEGLTPAALLVVLAGIPKWMLIESSLALTAGHDDLRAFIERHLVDAEPRRQEQEPVEATSKAELTKKVTKGSRQGRRRAGR